VGNVCNKESLKMVVFAPKMMRHTPRKVLIPRFLQIRVREFPKSNESLTMLANLEKPWNSHFSRRVSHHFQCEHHHFQALLVAHITHSSFFNLSLLSSIYFCIKKCHTASHFAWLYYSYLLP
jgi:hypothetical protein